MAAISTRNARVTVKTFDPPVTTLNILATHWTVEIQADEIDVTNFETGGFAEFLTSYVAAHISVDGFYQVDNEPFTFLGTPVVVAGNYLEIYCYMDRTGVLDYFHFPEAAIITCTGNSAVRDAARVAFTARNFGTFNYPGGFAFSGVEPD